MNPLIEHLVLDRPLAVIDLESTGVDPGQDRVVEIAVLKVLPGGFVEPHHWRVNPGRPIPAAATAIHGITDADVAAAPTFRTLAPMLNRLLDGCDLAGFGIVAFDLPLLSAEFARAEVPFHVAGRAVLDALTLYRRREPRDLTAALRFYLDAERVGAHSAAADATAALTVLDAQIGRYGLPGSPAALHDALVDVDVSGRFRRDPDGRIVFAFGKHSGRGLDEVAGRDPDYLRWMLGRPFLDDVRDLVRRALARRR